MFKIFTALIILLLTLSSCNIFTKKDWQNENNKNNIDESISWDTEGYIDRSDEWIIYTSDNGYVQWIASDDDELIVSPENPFNF